MISTAAELDRFVMCVSEAGYPPTEREPGMARWDRPVPLTVANKAAELCGLEPFWGGLGDICYVRVPDGTGPIVTMGSTVAGSAP